MSEQVDEKRKGTTEKKEEEGTGQVGQIDQSVPKMSGDRGRRVGRRPGRRASKMDVRAKLERSRQSARECRARKKLRYQYLEDLVANREKAVFALRDELEMCKQWCIQVDQGIIPPELLHLKDSVDERKDGTSSPATSNSSSPYSSRHSSPAPKPKTHTSTDSPGACGFGNVGQRSPSATQTYGSTDSPGASGFGNVSQISPSTPQTYRSTGTPGATGFGRVTNLAPNRTVMPESHLNIFGGQRTSAKIPTPNYTGNYSIFGTKSKSESHLPTAVSKQFLPHNVNIGNFSSMQSSVPKCENPLATAVSKQCESSTINLSQWSSVFGTEVTKPGIPVTTAASRQCEPSMSLSQLPTILEESNDHSHDWSGM